MQIKEDKISMNKRHNSWFINSKITAKKIKEGKISTYVQCSNELFASCISYPYIAFFIWFIFWKLPFFNRWLGGMALKRQ